MEDLAHSVKPSKLSIMKTSPTQRSLALLRKEGYTAQVVERYSMYARVRIDLFGCIDIVAIKPGVPGVLGVQTTSRGNMNSRIKKSVEIPELKMWIECGNLFEVHGWSKKGKAGKRKLWVVDKLLITTSHLSASEA